MKLRISLEAQLLLFCLFVLLLATGTALFINLFVDSLTLIFLFTTTLCFPLLVLLIKLYMRNTKKTIGAIINGFHNFLDGDFSINLINTRSDELGDVVAMYNKASNLLRTERNHLYQREMLLDTVIQTTPVCLLLVDESDIIIYSNSNARKLFHQGKAINGLTLSKVLTKQVDAFAQAINSGLDGLFTVKIDDTEETFHLTQNKFMLNNREHALYLLKSLTTEINRKEVQTWKKVIRIISHELNNSLAPISSLAHSGQIKCQQEEPQQLESIFATIEERARHLHHFIEGYARFARLPKPQIKMVDVTAFFNNLQKIENFEFSITTAETPVYFDPAQVQQCIINLVKNAYEAGSPREAIIVKLKANADIVDIQILDRGKGMSETNLSQALLPFYSTKQYGTGLGLPLCREIIEAHGGKMMLSQRPKGGIKIAIQLPNFQHYS